MDHLMDTLMASALQQSNSTDQTTPDDDSADAQQYPRNGWTAGDVKRCLGSTDEEYNQLYSRIEEAMRAANLIEASLTGQRKTKLFALLDTLLPHDSLPNVPDMLRLKALHQLAIKINGNVKKRSGHAHHRRRPGSKTPRTSITTTTPETRRSLPTPASNQPSPSVLQTPQPTPQPIPQASMPQAPMSQASMLQAPIPQVSPQIADGGQYSGLGSMVLLAERSDDNAQSTNSLKHITSNYKLRGPITVDNVSFDALNAALRRDGVIRGHIDDNIISWKWGDRLVKVPNERVLRTVVEFMSSHGGFIEFRVDPASLGEQVIVIQKVHELIRHREF